MAGAPHHAPDNLFGISDPAELDRVAGRLATARLARLEDDPPMTSFTRVDLVGIHSFLMRDTYPWAGEIRTTDVGAMGMAMCRAQFVDNELDRVIRDIGDNPPSTTAVDAAVTTVADHWSEMTMVHPGDQVAVGTLTATEGIRDNRPSAEIFHDMMTYRRAHPGQPYQTPGQGRTGTGAS